MTESNVLAFDLNKTRAEQLLREIAKDSARIVFTQHAKSRMDKRRITHTQVIRCLTKGHIIEGPARDIKGNWKMTLEILTAGTVVKTVAALDYDTTRQNYVIVVTVFH